MNGSIFKTVRPTGSVVSEKDFDEARGLGIDGWRLDHSEPCYSQPDQKEWQKDM